MDEWQIQQVAAVLVSWNPLGFKVSKVADLNGYRTEAIDIISTIGIFGRSKSASSIVADVLNQAFDLKLSASQCESAAKEIIIVVAGAR
jgi:hypothetical protein